MNKISHLPSNSIFMPLPEDRQRFSYKGEEKIISTELAHMYRNIEKAVLSKTCDQTWPEPAELAAMAFLGGITAYLSGIYYILPIKQHWRLNEHISDRIFNVFYLAYQQNPDKLNKDFVDFVLYQFSPQINDDGPYFQNYVNSRFMVNWQDSFFINPYHDGNWLSSSYLCGVSENISKYGHEYYQGLPEEIQKTIDLAVPHIKQLLPKITANLR